MCWSLYEREEKEEKNNKIRARIKNANDDETTTTIT